jgi:hypothetical protein
MYQNNSQSTVDAWHLAFNAAKLAKAQNAGWQRVSPNPWPAEAASLRNSQHRRLDFAFAPSNAEPTAPAAGARAAARSTTSPSSSLGKVEAPDEAAAMEKAAGEFKVPADRADTDR